MRTLTDAAKGRLNGRLQLVKRPCLEVGLKLSYHWATVNIEFTTGQMRMLKSKKEKQILSPTTCLLLVFYTFLLTRF